MANRRLFIVAAGSRSLDEERYFADEIKPDIRKVLEGYDGIVKIEIFPLGKGAIEVSFDANSDLRANGAYAGLMQYLGKNGYTVLEHEPRQRIDTGAARPGRRRTAKVSAATTPKSPRGPEQITEVRRIILTGTPEQIRKKIAYLRTLGGVEVGDVLD